MPEASSPTSGPESLKFRRRRPTRILIGLVLLAAAACRREAVVDRQVMLWRPVNTWTGHTSLQTESFPGETGAFRIDWESRPEPGAPQGRLKVTLHSAISGRPLAVVVDHEGVGHDKAYVSEDPREFYLVIDAEQIDWTVKVEEGIRAVSRQGQKN